jgi:hypothetical protein
MVNPPKACYTKTWKTRTNYSDRLAALRVQAAFTDTVLWDNDGLLPEQMSALMPAKREAFAPAGEVVVTHGGISIEEVIVPFIQITKESK